MRRKGGGFFVGKYQKSKIKNWSRQFAEDIRNSKPKTPWDCPISISIKFKFPWNKSAPAKLKSKKMWKTTRPDLDNMEKTILDVLVDEGFMVDDSLICSKSSFKWNDPNYGIEIELRKLLDDEV